MVTPLRPPHGPPLGTNDLRKKVLNRGPVYLEGIMDVKKVK